MTLYSRTSRYCDLRTVVQALKLAWTTEQQQAAGLGYASALRSAQSSRRPLADWLDDFQAALAGDRQVLWFDTLARPAGFGIRSRTPAADASVLTRKKDVLDHCTTRLHELLAAGEALTALRAAPAYNQAPIGAVTALVGTLAGTEQYKLYRDAAGRPAGLLSWAWISDWTVDRLKKDIRAPLHPCEWSEGDQLYFRDIAVSTRCAEAMCTDLCEGLFGAAPFCWIGLQGVFKERGDLVKLGRAQRCGFSSWLRSRTLGASAA